MFKATSALIVASATAADLIAVVEPEVQEFPTKAVVNMLAGVVYGFVDLNELPEFKTCFKASMAQYPHLEKAVQDVMAGHTKDAITEVKALVAALPAVIDTCKQITDDEAALAKWAAQFSDLKSAEKILEKNALLHHKAIMADLDSAETDFSAGSYFKSGRDVADIIVKAMGPVAKASAVSAEVDQDELISVMASLATTFNALV